jgi:hypothetical protein
MARMSPRISHRFSIALVLGAAAATLSCAGTQKREGADQVHAVAWPVDNTREIGGYPVETVGKPKVAGGDQGKSLCFGGEDAVVLPINPLDMQYDFTIQALIKPIPGGGEVQQFLHLQDGDDSRVLLEIRNNDENWRLHTFVRSGKEQMDVETEVETHDVDKWYWVALTYDQESSTLRHYVNGYEEGRATFARTPMKRGEMAIGTRLSREHFFKGCVREVRFATAALSGEELAATE